MSPSTERILHRTDIHLLPFLALLFLLNSVDRSNIGNAESAGFTKYAGLKPEDLNDAVAAFFIAFVALQPVGAALGKRVGVGRWVGSVMIGWGLLTCLTAFVRTRGQLITLRVCIGALEAGFYPATVFYLSLFYTRYEFAVRLGIFFGQYAVAGAFGGLVSYIVFSLFPSDDIVSETSKDGGGWHSYQVLFICEGILTIVVAVITLLWLPTGPGTAWWLTLEERAFAEQRIATDRASDSSSAPEYTAVSSSSGDDDSDTENSPEYTPSSSASSRTPIRHRTSHPLLKGPTSSTTALKDSEPALTRADIFLAFTDTKVWYILLINILSSIPSTAFSIFLPLVLSGLGVSPLAANALTIPPFLCGAFTLWTITYYSDKARCRIPYILLGLVINVAGLFLALVLPESWITARYLSLCVLLAGSYVASPLTVAWLSGNIKAPGRRAVVLGINGWGNLAGVIAGWLFAPEYRPGYKVPLTVTLAAVFISAVGYMGLWVWVKRENKTGRPGVGRWRRWLWRKVGGRGEVREETAEWGL
ncbi:Similar to Uncharacterized transporter C1039.04; acc. no. Q9US37 [Pyronema omphalodes CBS 100304]|uniref:Similar to Uncharacterized transporter C1039.04 acc. no. Q9US37 n=1 Tax=Pyronema omphalodes (strain CBS 100304) TaxID=1076935 RepID=U4L709_PYROM|nr:Similar to Uncharacterized transporter C1039.04; acc. no. Q9US37 [Pyronema omphalodes CBS 100304]